MGMKEQLTSNESLGVLVLSLVTYILFSDVISDIAANYTVAERAAAVGAGVLILLIYINTFKKR